MKKLIIKRLSAMILILILILMGSAFIVNLHAVEIPKHIQEAHLKCIEDELVIQGTDLNNSNGYLFAVIAVECEKIIGWKKK